MDEKGNPQGSQIVFTRNASESLNLVARTLGPKVVLGPDDEVVISIMEHHSNLIPWQQLCRQTGAKLTYLRLDDDYRITPEEVAAKIGPHTKIVSVTQVSNVLGVQNDVKAIARRAHEVGAYMVVDGAQSVPHIAVDVRDLDCDLMAFSAHKLGGPMGIGVLWGKPEVLDAMPPFLTGGEMIDAVTETDALWAPVPQKFEAGTQDAAGSFATGVAIDYLAGHGMDALERRERELATYLCDSLDMSQVCIRAGHHCAQPLLSYLKVENGATCRASVAFYNDKQDVDRLVEGLDRVWSLFGGAVTGKA